MNEEALKDAYNLFVSEGYEGTMEGFINLLRTNPEALNDSFSIFQSEGYENSIDDFQNLLGLKKKDATELSSSVLEETLQMGTEDSTLDSEPSESSSQQEE